MSFVSQIKALSPIFRTVVANSSRTLPRAALTARIQPHAGVTSIFCRHQAIRFHSGSNVQYDDKPISLTNVLDREIQEEVSELNQRLQSDQFPGFSVETDDSDVKLTKQVGDTTVVVRFTVSSSLTEWRTADDAPQQQQQNQGQPESAYSLLSMPEFQVQISRNNKTLEVSCYFEEPEQDEETGEPFAMDPTFNIDEMVMYQGEPRETEFAVSAEYFREDLQDGLIQYLAEHGIDDEFAKNLVSYSTNYEKKQYIGLMKRLREFVAK